MLPELPVKSFTVKSKKQLFRWLATRLPSDGKRRVVVLTGARQTGKTTLARQLYRHLRYVNLDAIEEREAMRGLRSGSWGRAVGPAVIDEAQKEPGVFDKVKLAYDERQNRRSRSCWDRPGFCSPVACVNRWRGGPSSTTCGP